jgi:hypothetical protein
MTNNSGKKSPRAALVMGLSKSGLDVGVKVALDATAPGLSALYDFAKLTIAEVKEYRQNRDQNRAENFHQALLRVDGAWNTEFAQADIQDVDFHALFSACMADIEEEKVERYAALTRSIAFGQVQRDEKRFFIMSLKELTNDDLERLRKAHIASRYDLVPTQGTRFDAKITRDPESSYRNFGYEQLLRREFTKEGSVTPLGQRFVTACYSQIELLPSAIGTRAFDSRRLAVVSYEMESPEFLRFYDGFAAALRARGMKCMPPMALLPRPRFTPLPTGVTHGLIVCGSNTARLKENYAELLKFVGRVKSVGLCLSGGSIDALADLPLAGFVAADGTSYEVLLERICDLLDNDAATSKATST